MEYARFTEGSNSIDYLEKAVSFIKSAENKPEDWKWVILAVQGALYGFMICNLKGTAPDNVSKGKSQDLISFDEALRRCQDPKQQPQKPKRAQDADWRSLGGFSTFLELSEDQKQALRRLHSEFRNQFVHYRPASWSIQLDGMSEMLMHAFDTLSAVLKMGCFYSHFESGDNDRIAALVAEGKALLRKAQEN